jgi:hypothetical protein
VALRPGFFPYLGPGSRWLSVIVFRPTFGSSLTALFVLISYTKTLVYAGSGVNSLSAGLGRSCLSYAASVLALICLSCSRLFCATAPAGIGICAYGNPAFWPTGFRLSFSAALRSVGRVSNRNSRGNFCSRLQKFPCPKTSVFWFRKFFWPLGRGAPPAYLLLACQ